MIFLLFALCIWKSCSPFVFVFYHVAKFMQEITPSIKSLPGRCRKGCSMMKYEYFSQKKKKKHLPWNLFCFVFPAYSVFGVHSWSSYHNIQPSFTNVVALSKELCAGRVHRSNIFPNVCGHTGVCFSLEITGKILRFTGDDLNSNSLKFSLKVKLFNSTAKAYHYWV